MSPIRHALIAALLITPAPALDAQTPEARAVRMDSVFAAMDRTTSPGCAAGALQDGRFLHARGYGMADLERGVPITSRSVFYSGSVSKQFTAMSIALLARDGVINLDEPARKYLPEIPEAGAGITIRHMVHHLSGLREKWDLFLLSGGRSGDLVTQDDVLDMVRRQRDLNFAPGTDHLYNNTAYDLLATLVGRAGGRGIREFAEARIFGPLGMTQSRFVDSRATLVPQRASGYSLSGGVVTLDLPNVETVGSGSVYTSLDDLARWDESFYTGALGGQELVRLVTTPGRLSDGTPLTYAFGLTADTWRGLQRVHHGGALAGFRTMIMRFPDQHFSAIVLCNFGQANPQALAERIAGIYLGDKLAPAPAPVAPNARPAFGDESLAARIAGVYRSTLTGQAVRMEQDGNVMFWVPGPRVPVTAAGGARVRFPTLGAQELVFELPATGPATGFVETGFGPRAERFVRAEPAGPSAAAWAGLVGRYTSPELGVTWTLALKGDSLVATMARGQTATLVPAYRDGFTAGGTLIVVERDRRGRATGLLVTPGRSRNIRFERER